MVFSAKFPTNFQGFCMRQIHLRKQPRASIKPEWSLGRKIKVWMLLNIVPFLTYPLIRTLTLTYRWRYKVPTEMLELMASDRPFVVAIWHSDMLLSQSLGKLLGWSNRVAIMVSLSQIGEIESRLLKVLGYYVVRGSEKERTKEALEDMKDIINQGTIAAMVVDGPSGPAKKIKAGVVYLAKHCKIPIVPLSFTPGREIRLSTWDNTRIPIPFSRCIVTSSVPIHVPDDIDNVEFDKQIEELKDIFAELEKRRVTWEGAKDINMKLLNIYNIRDYIDSIEDSVSDRSYDDFSSSPVIQDTALRKFKDIIDSARKVKRYLKKRYPDRMWGNISEIEGIVKDGNPGLDIKGFWNVVNRDIPDLKESINFIIEKEFSFDSRQRRE